MAAGEKKVLAMQDKLDSMRRSAANKRAAEEAESARKRAVESAKKKAVSDTEDAMKKTHRKEMKTAVNEARFGAVAQFAAGVPVGIAGAVAVDYVVGSMQIGKEIEAAKESKPYKRNELAPHLANIGLGLAVAGGGVMVDQPFVAGAGTGMAGYGVGRILAKKVGVKLAEKAAEKKHGITDEAGKNAYAARVQQAMGAPAYVPPPNPFVGRPAQAADAYVGGSRRADLPTPTRAQAPFVG